MKHIITFFSFLCLLFITITPAQAAKKCSDFKTQTQAQTHYKSLKSAKKTGWKSLDRNKDGIACECLKKNTCSKGKRKGVVNKKKTSKVKSTKTQSVKKSTTKAQYKKPVSSSVKKKATVKKKAAVKKKATVKQKNTAKNNVKKKATPKAHTSIKKVK